MIDRCKFLHNLPCEQVSDRIVELESENENLLRTVDSVMPSLIEDNARLKVENAKLRECLQDFADAIKNDDGFGVDQGWMLERMRGLGIEADNDD